MIIFITPTQLVIFSHTITEKCLIWCKVTKGNLPSNIYSYIEQQRHHNHHGSEHLPAVTLRANVGNGGYDAYHVVPAQATAILRADEEKKHDAKHECHVEHEYVYATVGYARIAFDDEI